MSDHPPLTPPLTPPLVTPLAPSPLAPRGAALDGRIELKIPAAAQWVRVARLTVAGVASRLHFDIAAIEDIKLATAEAINNAILHASVAPGADACVTIVLESDENGLWISVADEGRVRGGLPVSPLPGAASEGESWPEVESWPDADWPESGMGLLLIRSLMDEVTHQSGAHADTVVRMFKRLPAPRTSTAASTGAPTGAPRA